MNKRYSPNQMLHQIGGWYLTILIGVIQLVSLLGTLPGIFAIWANVRLEEQTVRGLPFTVFFLVIISFAVLIGISRRLTQGAIKSSTCGRMKRSD